MSFAEQLSERLITLTAETERVALEQAKKDYDQLIKVVSRQVEECRFSFVWVVRADNIFSFTVLKNEIKRCLRLDGFVISNSVPCCPSGAESYGESILFCLPPNKITSDHAAAPDQSL